MRNKKHQDNNVKINKLPWHSFNEEKCLDKLFSTRDGLSVNEANDRIVKFGKNQLPPKKAKSVFKILFEELINPIVILLLFASAFSFIVSEILDGCVIIAIILIDLTMGTIQEKKAQRIAQSLSDMIKHKVKVLRDGEKCEIDSTELVPGDIVFLESGDKSGADMRILTSSNLTIDEAILTGESINAVKQESVEEENTLLGDRKNMVYAGCSVISGRATCVVCETGLNTEIGKIATGINDVKDEKSPLDIRIKKFSKQITFAVVLVAVVIFVVLYLQGNDISTIFLSVVALAVSAIPEGLPLAVTMALTIAANRMGKNNVVVKKLNAVESLGSCTVIATDKTGTLTLNQQTAKIIVLPGQETYDITGSGYNFEGEVVPKGEYELDYAKTIATLGALNNEAKLYKRNDDYHNFGDSIDVAFLSLGHKLKVDLKNISVVGQIPYESENKYSAAFCKNNNEVFSTVKGSMEKVLSFSKYMKVGDEIVPLDTQLINSQHENLAKMGYRVIAIAGGRVEDKHSYEENDLRELVFLGMVGFIDPIRLESKAAIESCHTAGIKVIMITGDHPLTAFAIAKEINIASNKNQVAVGDEVEKWFSKSEKDFDAFVSSKTVFSRVTPSDKLHIIESLKRQDEFVAVTGDGVNDAPAIKSAHIGIAMGNGTDVAKETADMIITDDNFNSIVKGVKEGRNAYSNIRKVTYLLLSSALAEIIFFLTSIICGLPLPLLAIQLLWLNVITDGLQDLALSFEKAEMKIMSEKPRPTKESLFSKSLLQETLVSGVYMGVVVFVVWLFLIQFRGDDLIYARSLTMALMVFLQNFQALNCRSETQSLFRMPAFSNKLFIFSIIGATALQILFMEVDALSHFLSLTNVSYLDVLILLAFSLTIIGLMECYKLIIRKKEKKFSNKT